MNPAPGPPRTAGELPAFRTGPVAVRVPATSANLGPGFDSLGLALQLDDELVGRIVPAGLLVDVDGEGAADVPRDEDHLVVRAMRAAFELLGGQPPGLSLVCANRIPHARGLGSSAAAIVGGIVLARAMVLDGDTRLPDPVALRLADRLEGHPDNVAACLYGALTVSWREPGGAAALRLEPVPEVQPVIFVPPFGSSTDAARAQLPPAVPHADAARTAGRAALLVAALTGAPQALLAATEDCLHQPYRAAGMPQTAELVARLRALHVPSAVSGAGPAVLALARDQAELARASACAPAGWSCRSVAVARGASVAAALR